MLYEARSHTSKVQDYKVSYADVFMSAKAQNKYVDNEYIVSCLVSSRCKSTRVHGQQCFEIRFACS